MVQRSRLWAVPVVLLLVVAVTGCDWPSYLYGPDHSGSSPDTSISKAAVQGSMVLNWTASTGAPIYGASPAVANGIVYVASDRLYAFDAKGNTNCSGAPKSCAPLWTADTSQSASSPAVINGVVYVVGGQSQTLYAFDAAGTTNCSGMPKTCAPLWTAKGIMGGATPTVANGVLYVADFTGLLAFDAAGETNCSGTPKVCAPLWKDAAVGHLRRSSPAVSNGVVYAAVDPNDGSHGEVDAFDAAGHTNCAGTPKVCTPLWSAPTNGSIFSSPAVVNGVVFITDRGNALKLYAFDAAGNTSCAGTPKICAPLWTADTKGAEFSSPAVANGIVYVGSTWNHLYGFDAAGNRNCSGTPKVCTPLIDGQLGSGEVFSAPSVANGVVYLGDDSGLYAFDAAGGVNCSGTPAYCHPLWHQDTMGLVESTPSVANGFVYVGSFTTNKLYAFSLEKVRPVTAIVQPSTGATLSGTTMLDATASDNVRVSKVEFRLTGGSLDNSLVGTGTPTGTGQWSFQWDTTNLANGNYALTSVAYDPAGNVGRSSAVEVTVSN